MADKKKFVKPQMQAIEVKMTGMLASSMCPYNTAGCSDCTSDILP